MPRPNRRRHWKKILFAWFGSVVILVILLLKTDTRLRTVFHLLREMDPLWLLLVFAISAAFHILLGAAKWYVILRGIGCETSYAETLFVRMGSDPIRFAMPFKTGELSNMLYYSRTGRLPLAESASWVAFDKAINFLGTLFWLGVGILLTRAVPGGLRWSVLLAGAALVLLVCIPPLRAVPIALAGRIHAGLGRLARQLLVTFERIGPRRRLGLAGLAVVFQLRPLIVCYLLFGAFLVPVFRSRPEAPEVLAKGSVAVVASNFPGTVHGVGPRELVLVELFGNHLAHPEGGAGPRQRPRAVGAAPLVAIGIMMAVAIHLIPAILGLPLMAGLLTAIEEGRRPGVNGAGAADEEHADPEERNGAADEPAEAPPEG